MIENLVSDLPEIYQPIYGHTELSGQVSRPCLDRLERIARIHDALQRLLGRPLKILDLGCAQGYFSLSLAERGANVHGIDYLDKNIAVCNALAQAHPQLHVSFETVRVEDVIERLEPGRYDLVLGLSVFHHIVHERGAEAVKTLLERVTNQSGALIVELALREEPLYWASAQPQDPRTLLESIAFVHEVARHATHLAPIPRPLFVASNRYWILEDRAEQFDNWSFDPHALAHGTHEGSRRYFFSADCILKLYRFDHPRGAHNKAEFKREVLFLQSSPADFPVPALIVFGESETSAWLATQRLPGRLLLDLLREGVTIDSRAILLAVLAQLAALEEVGLYHDDVRTWNVLVAEDGATHLIDYGSISNRVQDCVWPGNLSLSFFIFVREVATGVVDDPDPLRTISISPYGLPQPYRAWATSLWRRPLAEWSFELMHQTLLETPVDGADEPLQQSIEAWMKATEEAIQAQKLFVNDIRHQASADKHQYHQMLMTIADSHSRELDVLGESFKQLGQALQGKMSLAETLEKQLAWAQEQLLHADRRRSMLEGKVAEHEQRAAAAEESVRDQQKRIDELGGNSHYWWQQAGALEAELIIQREQSAKHEHNLTAAHEQVSTLDAKTQWLQTEWDAAQQKIAALNHQAGALEAELITQREQSAQHEHNLTAAHEQVSTLDAKTQWLQNEWDAAQQKIAALNHQAGALEAELIIQREQSAQQEHNLTAAHEQVSTLDAKTQWLQNEWDAAKAKVDELNHSSHHWWTVADQLNQELQGVYASKSWRITLPLRKTMLASKWVLALPTRTVRWALRQPKRIAKPMMLWAMRKTIANPRLKARALNVLNKHPQLKQHLRQFAMRAGLIASWDAAMPVGEPVALNAVTVSTVEPTSALIRQPIMQTELPASLSPRAARIYGALMRAAEARKS